MRILDRQRYWSFFKAYLICFVSLVGLVIVIDAFANVDEFSEVASGKKLLSNMSRYYLVRMSLYYDLLSGVIGMMAAVFAATWMQRNNELLAILAAGVGTKRVIVPIIVGAVIVNSAGVANQEFIMPDLADELQKPPDDFAGRKLVMFRSRKDLRGIILAGGDEGDPRTQSIKPFDATLPISLIGALGSLTAAEARYIPDTATRSPLRGGWLLRRAQLSPSDAPVDPEWLVKIDDKQLLDQLPTSMEGLSDLGGDTYFLRSNVSFASRTRKPNEWFRYASTPELVRALGDPSNDPEKRDISVFLHGRVVRPMLGVALLFMTLPQVLGGAGRNMFINLGLSLGTTALFYIALTACRFLGGNGYLSPELSAWAPLIGFGTLAAARWDRIHT